MIDCTAMHILGVKLFVTLTPEQAHAAPSPWDETRVVAFEDNGSGEILMHDVLLVDLEDISPE